MRIGDNVCVLLDSVQSRPELNGRLGRIVSVDATRERCGVQIGDEVMSLRQRCLEREDMPPWESCRHGGPPPNPKFIRSLQEFLEASLTITAPCVEHVRLFEPLLRRHKLPAVTLASMGVDAFAAADLPHCRAFAVSALVLRASKDMGVSALFSALDTSAAPSAALRELEANLSRCTTADGLREVLGMFTTCTCLRLLRARGLGLKQVDVEPSRHPVLDPLFDGTQATPVDLPPAPDARPRGERVGQLALQLLDEVSGGTPLSERVMQLRRECETLHRVRADDASRAACRETSMTDMQAQAVAGVTFTEAGGIARIEAMLERALCQHPLCQQQQQQQSPAADFPCTDADFELLLGLEALADLQSLAMASVALAGRAARQACSLVDLGGHPIIQLNALKAVWAVLRNAAPADFTKRLGVAALRSVVVVCGDMFTDILENDVLDFSQLDIVSSVVTLIAGASEQLCKLVATVSARGIPHVVPTSLAIILMQHAHELCAGRSELCHPLGDWQHLLPINLSLQGLYTISLHFDLRAVQIGTGDGPNESFDESIREYADFLHGLVHHQCVCRYTQAYLARILAFTPAGAPPMDPRPRPIETETEQHRRLMQLADGLQRARLAVRRQRSRARETGGASEAVRCAATHRARGNEEIGAGRNEAALVAYTSAVEELAGLEDEAAAWALVLALSNRSQALLNLSRHEAMMEDVTSAQVLLERYRASFDADEIVRIEQKLNRREAESRRTLDKQQQPEQRPQAELQRDAQRHRARTERRRRAIQLRNLRREARAEAAAEVADAVERMEEGQLPNAEPAGPECTICLDDTGEPLEDVCGYGHMLHAECATQWRMQCFRWQMAEPEKHDGPQCPECRRPI
eukprot:Hpha_TRINITY_DN7834_c0_g1::TRINITY_DN7834_c0_g1_i1::g.185555::m.185555